jgi:RNA polymerase sigma factor FliA
MAQRSVPRQGGRGDAAGGSPKTTSTATTPEIEGLVTDHLPLVGHIARETASRMPRHLGTDDLVGAGSLALVQAAHSFDPALGVPFARFANTRIRGAMIDQMRQRDWASRSLRTRARALAAAAEHLTTALGRAPDDAEVAKAAGLTEAEVREVRSGTDRATLLTLDPLATDGEGLGSTLADSAPRPEEALIAAERMGYLRDAIAELPERLRVVVAGYYLQQRPLTEIAEELGVTQSRASQLRSEGLDLLREALEALLGDGARAGRANRGAKPDDGRPAGVTASGRAVQPPADPGVRARRREAYVDAVARRSGTSQRANVQAYLDGETLVM